MLITHLECMSCRSCYDFTEIHGVCEKCGSSLSARYDLERAKERLTRKSLPGRVTSLWRYREVLPVVYETNVITLGEGLTPIIKIGGKNVSMKDDGLIPTGTFKARGLSVGVSKARELGLTKLAIPSAGNAGAALACYSAVAGISAKVFMPKDAPPATILECKSYGAEVVLVSGHIGDAAVELGRSSGEFFDMSTLKEPYRLEGKKTMGYEIAEQMGFHLPDAIIYPTGGGTGLLGMWKAFAEMEVLGMIGKERPRMFSVQSEGCAPIVRAFNEGRAEVGEPFPNPHTVASGLRVPRPFASRQILKAIRESGGGAVAVSEGQIIGAMKELASKVGLLACPEGAATLAAYRVLRAEGQIAEDERALLYNTGTGLKYLDLLS